MVDPLSNILFPTFTSFQWLMLVIALSNAQVILALINKAHAEIISAIDSLFLIFAGSNVMKAKTQQNQEKEKGETNGIQNK